MISALRKIEGRGELEGATSAVMEMCIDNPREGFADLFATHPPIESRIAALIQFAGGHDPGPLELPETESPPDASEQQEPPAPGPWSGDAPPPKPFLPSEPPVTLGGANRPGQGRFLGRPPKLNVDPPGTSHAINNTTFFEWDPATYNAYFNKIKDAHDITIPKLNEMACEQVEIASVPYVSFVANKAADGQAANYSFVLRGYVRHWLGNVWAEFDRIKLIDMVAPELQRKGAARQA